ncbi:hypothetical protein TWF106_003071 [Orbilia oligospora]|uniref:Uncharacterized protein n=1 Tax=Orbilia oligospora TaxID=2813651 RepID=A0A6G1LQB6_ORBOL|nr:hypothetical protein TWF106_003071 [Orbilia oligospora]KAF3203812.1 hypothetical protein TWF191_002551 [Orbilia oligospora]KAF3215376.1 hypothetical protein TWF679_003900 [Orbilia oligospora]KAF3230966.1 hypothetical protein TWF192_003868 [Orbilia oligospora]
MSAMTMEEELKRIRELYDPRRDSTDIFAKQYMIPTHDNDYEDIIVNPSGVYGNMSNTLSPYSLGTPVEPTELYTNPTSRQFRYGHAIQYSEEERMLHFDPSYRPHRRLIRTGQAATIIFGIVFVLSSVAFSITIVGKPYISYPAKIVQTVLVAIGAVMYVLRALVNWRVREALGRVLGKGSSWGCEKHEQCSEQRYRLYGDRRLEIAFGSLVILMVGSCAICWLVKL